MGTCFFWKPILRGIGNFLSKKLGGAPFFTFWQRFFFPRGRGNLFSYCLVFFDCCFSNRVGGRPTNTAPLFCRARVGADVWPAKWKTIGFGIIVIICSSFLFLGTGKPARFPLVANQKNVTLCRAHSSRFADPSLSLVWVSPPPWSVCPAASRMWLGGK